MSLHPQSQDWLDELKDAPPFDFSNLYADEFRAAFGPGVVAKTPTAVHKVTSDFVDLGSGERELRFYYPSDEPDLPVTVFFHGGGFVIGGPDMTDEICRRLALASGGVVVSVDYRLAPEHPFPEGLNDGAAAVRYVVDHATSRGIDPDAVALAGDSSGGTFAAALALASRDGELPPIRHQLLIYPVLDASQSSSSYSQFAEGYLLTSEMMGWYWRQYLDGPTAADWRASPFARQDLAGVAAATIFTAEFDVVRDEAELYAERLRQAGVPVELKRWRGHIHGFLLRPDIIDDVPIVIAAAGSRLRQSFSNRNEPR